MIAQRIEWLVVYEMAIARAVPKLAPYFAPSTRTLYRPRLFIWCTPSSIYHIKVPSDDRIKEQHAGFVAGDMELAEIALRFGQGIEHGLLLGHIDPDRHHALVGAGEAVGRLFDRIFLDVSHDHVCTRLRERGRNAQPDAGSGAGDDGGLAGDVHSQGAFRMVRFVDILTGLKLAR